MKRKILTLCLLTLNNVSFAQDALEDAIILNDEMQFLEESARNSSTSAPLPAAQTTTRIPRGRRDLGESEGLEETYFDDTEQDSISTRTAAPKKRSF